MMKEIFILAAGATVAILLLRIARRAIRLRRNRKYDKACKIHRAQVFIDGSQTIDTYRNLTEKLDKLRSNKPYKPLEREPSMGSSSNETRLDGTEYSAAQVILGASDYMNDPDPSPSHSTYEGNGHGGDFGGGGASGSWDSGSSDSGSSDSSSWSD